MPRTHPPTLITSVRRCLKEDCVVERGQHLLLAVSGGPDSMALLSVLAMLREKLGFVLSAHGVDHGLRDDAAAELQLAQELASTLGVHFTTSQLRVAPGSNLQARARDARYRALDQAKQQLGANYLVTAHHAEDRAETVLLRLLRGSGLGGLAVLPPRQGALLRPMIRSPRQQVKAHLKRHHLAFALDPSNTNRRFLRVRVREELLPLLTQLSPGIVGHLCDLADQSAERARSFPLGDEAVPPRLGKAQRKQLARALALGLSKTEIPLAGGDVLALDAEQGTPIIFRRKPGR